jgi:hypothetical protein
VSEARAEFVLRGRNPDVLTCIANLSNDEVPTPSLQGREIEEDLELPGDSVVRLIADRLDVESSD